MKAMVIEAPAKINLTLDIAGERPDGYHELETVMHQINLVDRVQLRVSDNGLRIRSNSTELPENEGNLAYQAAELVLRNFKSSAGLDIFLEKNIPVGAGLAGGSSDAAAVLMGMNHLLDLQVPWEKLVEWGAMLGSDVPFCMQGGTALARGRGEILAPLKEGPLLHLLLVKPDFQLSTAEVYRNFSLDQVADFPDTFAFIEAWKANNIEDIAYQLKNVLESASIPMHPEIEEIKHRICKLGAMNALMSGSGPTVFGIFSSQEETRQAWIEMKQQYQESYVVSSYRRGDNVGRKEEISTC